ncbi:MAG TPA: hypothetical protein DCS42_09835 [Nitrospiraceae bacterium]|nr:MAG: hypothetical protein A2072_08030 [Nitrospirae bacterium GWC1_57_7]OGW44785.1 MAG: hypothetical protein A2X57_05145 [Nitrospirae bacterium GWD2_57_8]HAR46258.1 hypothetical protein [Nitrospiraceae bacterium]HAS54393.1 hypothetical protein [Nitrospiraceae bacterium]
MVKKGPAKKLSIYVDESDKVGGTPVYEALIKLCYRNKISGVSVFRGVAGYGSDGVLHTSKILELSTTLPVKIEAVDSEEMIASLLPEVTELVQKGLVEVSDTEVIKCCVPPSTPGRR